MKKYIHGRRALLFKLFTVLSLTSINNLALANTEQFEQAYAPIMVGNITTFIPIDLTPDAVVRVSSKQVGDQTQLAWTPSSNAEYYKVLRFDGSNWVTVSSNLTSNFYDYNGTGEFRVLACHKYGCSVASSSDVKETGALSIQAFYAEDSVVQSGSNVLIQWQIKGASSYSLTKLVNGKVHTIISDEPAQSRKLNQTIDDVTNFNITAVGFNGEKVTKYLTVSTLAAERELPKNPLPQYGQPLIDLDLDINERTILYHGRYIYFSTFDNTLYRLKTIQSADGSNLSWQIDWQMKLSGAIASKPLISDNTLYFSQSHSGGKGNVCKIDLSNNFKSCSFIKDSNLIASPIIISRSQFRNVEQESSWLNWFSSDSNPNDSLIEGLYLFYKNGNIEIVDPNEMSNVIDSYSMPDGLNRVLTAPLVIGAQELSDAALQTMQYASNTNQVPANTLTPQFIYRDKHKLMGLRMPNSEGDTSVFKSLVNMVGLGSTSNNQNNNKLVIVWEKEF